MGRFLAPLIGHDFRWLAQSLCQGQQSSRSNANVLWVMFHRRCRCVDKSLSSGSESHC
jgi:hypothetical protein